MTDIETLAALLCETAPSEEGHSWYLTGRPAGPCTAHQGQAARLTGRVFVRVSPERAPPDVDRLVSAVRYLLNVDPHDIRDRRPCATCDAVRDALIALAENRPASSENVGGWGVGGDLSAP